MIQQMRVASLKPNPNNPRIIKDDKFYKLVESIKNFPEMLEARPIVVNQDLIVLGGNMRLKALIEAGIKEVPVEVVQWDEDKQRQFIIKDNVGFGEWDWNELANTWDSVELANWGLDIPFWKADSDAVETVNEKDEWIGMPEFESQEAGFKMVITFDNEEDREEFTKAYQIKITTKTITTWSASWPEKQQQDLSSLRYE
jgi:hypothetical protein